MVKYDQGQEVSAFESGLAGACSGAISRAILQPLDVLKIRFQLQVEPIKKTQGHYYNIFQATRLILKNEGFWALWKGHWSAQALTVSYTLGQFWAHTFFKHEATALGLGENGFALTVCGGLAGIIGSLISLPFDVARTRIVAQSGNQFSGTLDVWKNIIVRENFFQLWKGLAPTLLMTVPFTAIQFRIYYSLSDMMSTINVADTEMFGYRLTTAVVCGSTAGVCAKVVVYPFDVLKKRIQLKGAESIRSDFGKVVIYRSLWHCMKTVSREEGVLAWFKGLQPSLLKSAAFSASIFAFYDIFCSVITSSRKTGDE